ncbi:MAG: cation:proton antiporter [Solirubrobacteraceae bacterium]|nr:cation:proton antiporter [Solirubrobacteraceae bacterium]
MDFGALALVVGAGLLGPALASTRRLTAPLVVGEIGAGLLIGQTGLGWIDAGAEPLASLGEIGFALLMLVVGTHLPLRQPGLKTGLRLGAAATAATFVLAVPAAWAIREVTGLGSVGMIVLLLATSSAAIVLPVISDLQVEGRRVVAVMAWVAIADVVSVAGVPLVTSTTGLGEVLAGSLLVVVLAAGVYFLARTALAAEVMHHPERLGLERDWGLRLRLSVLALFTLSWVATSFSTSVLLAGFSLGFVIALLGEPDSLARELIGVGEGFLIPVFFVLLGAKVDARELFTDHSNLVLLVALVVGNVAVHLAVARVLRLGTPAGLVASAQMGVPSAIVAIGLGNGQLTAGQGAAIIVAAILTVGITAGAAAHLQSHRSRERAPTGPPQATT